MFSTCICGFIVTYFLAQIPWLICPKVDISFFNPTTCDPSYFFILRPYLIPDLFQHFLFYLNIERQFVYFYPIQFHSLILSTFASIIAPFGGFFASGFKRAFKIKDFADTIPGHGGIVDRMDCQLIMGVFSWVYCTTFFSNTTSTDVNLIFDQILCLPPHLQIQLFQKFQNFLVINKITDLLNP